MYSTCERRPRYVTGERESLAAAKGPKINKNKISRDLGFRWDLARIGKPIPSLRQAGLPLARSRLTYPRGGVGSSLGASGSTHQDILDHLHSPSSQPPCGSAFILSQFIIPFLFQSSLFLSLSLFLFLRSSYYFFFLTYYSSISLISASHCLLLFLLVRTHDTRTAVPPWFLDRSPPLSMFSRCLS